MYVSCHLCVYIYKPFLLFEMSLIGQHYSFISWSKNFRLHVVQAITVVGGRNMTLDGVTLFEQNINMSLLLYIYIMIFNLLARCLARVLWI